MPFLQFSLQKGVFHKELPYIMGDGGMKKDFFQRKEGRHEKI